MSEKIEKMKAMLEKMDKMTLAPVGESDKIRNSEARRQKLLSFIHYLHILRLDGSLPVEDNDEVMAAEELKAKINRIPDRDRLRREAIKLSVINDHTHTWYIARHYYEKCSKILCQMMITILDAMLEGETGESLLYTSAEKKNGFSVEREISLLTKSLRESYFYMCAYDYGTMRLAEYVGIEEYALLMPEHSRIAANGLPRRLERIAAAYCKKTGAEKIIGESFVTDPEQLYDEKLLERVYGDMAEDYCDIDELMHNYQNFIAEFDFAYAAELKKKMGC